MSRNVRTWLVVTALGLAVLLPNAAHAQDAQTCQPGIAGAYLGPHSAKYQAVINALIPAFGQLSAQLAALTDQTSYQALLNTANALAASLATARVVVTLPDGTVVLDTARDDNTADPKSNAYQHFLDKTINENHNSRLAILGAQEYACGVGLESKLSTTTGLTESYVAIRVGAQLDSLGTVRMSVVQ